jgi:hypothetical protein
MLSFSSLIKLFTARGLAMVCMARPGSVKSRSSNCHRTCPPVPAENQTCDTFSTNRSDEPLEVPVHQGEQGAQSADGEYPSFVLRPHTFDRQV